MTARVVAVANQKGGVAKTTTVASIAEALTELGRRVLVVDLDSQACLTFSLGIDPEQVGPSMHDVLIGSVTADQVCVPVHDRLDLLPATIDLARTEAHLFSRPGREFTLRSVLQPLRDRYDVILLDCSPSLGVLTLNALTAADEVVIPLQCEMLSHRGVGQLLDTVEDVTRILNPSLVVRGILPTMLDARTSHGRAVLADVRERYPVPVLEPPIPKSIRFAEAPALGESVLRTARSSAGAKAYREVTAGLVQSWTG